MNKPAFRVLRYLCERNTVRAAIPAPVRTEVLAAYERDLAEARALHRKTQKSMRALGLTVPPLPDTHRHYPNFFDTTLDVLSIQVLPWPTVAHEALTRRAAQRIRPFDTQGAGYRDALIWETVLMLARDGHSVHLVSNDNDFHYRNDLHPDLVEEVAATAGTVTIYRTLPEWALDLTGAPQAGGTQVPSTAAKPNGTTTSSSTTPEQSLRITAARARDDRLLEELEQSGFLWDYVPLSISETYQLDPRQTVEVGHWTVHDPTDQAIDDTGQVTVTYPIDLRLDLAPETADALSQAAGRDEHPPGLWDNDPWMYVSQKLSCVLVVEFDPHDDIVDIDLQLPDRPDGRQWAPVPEPDPNQMLLFDDDLRM